ncbi:HXXEE domain-containing protein [Kineococcus esterisolvens]|uniref:HXXEE domain-containing protein n=1 Tax=unclassified Kineococcus TaxID=2621656 RepID=UPI001F604B1C|nr:HXXEE domain-containing protein [Paenibacillus sp. TRM 82003]
MVTPSSRERALAAELFLTWLVHDLEEALTMAATSRRLATRLRGSPSPTARRAAERVEVSTVEAATAIALMGVLVAFATERGRRSAGGDPLYQYVLAGLQGHVLTHLAASCWLGGYSTGVLTAVTVLLPHTRRARQSLRSTGTLIEGPVPYVRGALLLLPATFACQGLARALQRRSRRRVDSATD